MSNRPTNTCIFEYSWFWLIGFWEVQIIPVSQPVEIIQHALSDLNRTHTRWSLEANVKNFARLPWERFGQTPWFRVTVSDTTNLRPDAIVRNVNVSGRCPTMNGDRCHSSTVVLLWELLHDSGDSQLMKIRWRCRREVYQQIRKSQIKERTMMKNDMFWSSRASNKSWAFWMSELQQLPADTSTRMLFSSFPVVSAILIVFTFTMLDILFISGERTFRAYEVLPQAFHTGINQRVYQV